MGWVGEIKRTLREWKILWKYIKLERGRENIPGFVDLQVNGAHSEILEHEEQLHQHSSDRKRLSFTYAIMLSDSKMLLVPKVSFFGC